MPFQKVQRVVVLAGVINIIDVHLAELTCEFYGHDVWGVDGYYVRCSWICVY